MEASLKFWKAVDMGKLAEHWHYKEKLPYDILAILPHVVEAKGIWDVAAGNDRVMKALRGVMGEGRAMVSSDVAPAAPGVVEWNVVDGVPSEARGVDTVLLLGVIQYLSNGEMGRVLSLLRKKKVLIKTPCYPQDQYVCKTWDKIGEVYESQYRAEETVRVALARTHKVSFVGRVYPDSMESSFGSTQMLFVGEVKP